MPRAKISDSFVRASDGSIVPNGTLCYVYLRATTTLAVLYASSAGEQTVPNPAPIVAGQVGAYVETASYDLTVTIDGVSTTTPFEAILASQIGTAPPIGVVAKTSAYSATSADNVILANATGGAFQVTLPSAVGFTGQLVVKATTTNTNLVTVQTVGEQTINGEGTSITLGTVASGARYTSINLVSDGVRWQII